jgi:hypothetical protein
MKVPNLSHGYIQPHVPRELREHYDKYMETAQWRVLRRKIYKRAKKRCELCHALPAVTGGQRPRRAQAVHHVTYDRLFFERLTDLLAVCFTCHAILHPGNDQLAEQSAKDEPWDDPRLESVRIS